MTMGFLSMLSAHIIITFLTTQILFCLSFTDSTFANFQERKPRRLGLRSISDDTEMGPEKDASSPTGTDFPLSLGLGGSGYNKSMSFHQAIVLAREEVKCLNKFGSQMNKTVVIMGSTKRALAQRTAIPFGCFQPETIAECEQCKQPIKTLEKCQHLCNTSETCKQACQGIYNGLKSEEIELPLNSDEGEDDAISHFNTNSSQKLGRGQLIQSLDVFCEGVTSIDREERFIHFITLKWNVNETSSRHLAEFSRAKDDTTVDSSTHSQLDRKQLPLIYVIQQKSGNMTEWKTIGKTPFGLQSVNVSYLSTTYKWRITAVGPNGIEDFAVTPAYITLNGSQSPGPPRDVYVIETRVKNSSVDVLIGWEPPDDKACFYKIVLEETSGEKGETVRIKDEPLGMHMYWFSNLTFGTIYHVRITSRDPSWNMESSQYKLEFRTPTCLEAFKYRFDKCAPPPPSNIKADIELLKTDHFIDQQFLVTLTWLPPLNTSRENRVEKYVVEISTFSLHQRSPIPIPMVNFSAGLKDVFLQRNFSKNNYTVAGGTTKLVLKDLKPDTEYTVMITAYSTRGRSPEAQYHFNTKLVKAELPHEAVGNWIYVTVTFTVAAALLLMCNLIRVFIHKRNVKIARNQYFQSMEERDEMGADWSIVPLTDDASNWKLFDENFPKEKWEIAWDEMTMAEVIGQGAFGVVRRAKIPRKKLETKLKFRGEDDSWFNSADRNIDAEDPEMETVAVKMVKVSSTRDDREQLIKEITMMQSLGFHSQIVGLLGACTKGRNLCLVLEYCPGGDLLTFVRKVRAKYWPTLGLSGAAMTNCSFPIKRGITAGMKLCGQTNSGSGDHRSSSASTTDNRKSFDSSPINYADIGGFSATCSSPENSSPGFNDGENCRRDCTGGNSAKTDNSIPPFFGRPAQHDFDEDDEFRPIDEKDVLSYARQIAMGMEYLEKNRVVHRDLACRNVLLAGDYKHVKISDFGLSRDIYTWNVYHQKSNGKLPIKWMAIESIFTHIFTTKSDVWSYGILLWELVTLGGTPYPGLGNTELFHLLKSGYRMERPDNCSEELYCLMKKCWRTAAAARPNFTELRRHVETMMEAAEPNLYLSLMADLPVDFFQLSSRSDIPLIGKDESTITTPLRDSIPGSSSTNLFSSSHNSSLTKANRPNYPIPSTSGCIQGGSTKKPLNAQQSHSTHRKSQSMYHNTTFTNDGLDDSIQDSDGDGISLSTLQDGCSKDTLKAILDSNASTTANNPSSPLTPSGSVFNGERKKSSESFDPKHSSNSRQLSPQPNNQLFRPSSTSSTSGCYSDSKLMSKKAPQRGSESSSIYENNDVYESGLQLNESDELNERRDSVHSPDSGILLHRANNCDPELASLNEELEDVFEEGEGESESKGGCRRPLIPSRSLEVEGITQRRSPSTSPISPSQSSSFKFGERGGSFKSGSRQSSPRNSQKRPKITLPFINVNDMTIIENRTYDLRDN